MEFSKPGIARGMTMLSLQPHSLCVPLKTLLNLLIWEIPYSFFDRKSYDKSVESWHFFENEGLDKGEKERDEIAVI